MKVANLRSRTDQDVWRRKKNKRQVFSDKLLDPIIKPLSLLVVRPDTGNQQRRKDDINDDGLHEDPAELGFFLSRDPRNRCNDAKTSVFWSLDAGLG